MAKVTEYSRITKLKDNDILLVDGPDGTRTILQSDAAKELVGQVVKVTEVSGEEATVSVVNGDTEIELAKQNDVSNLNDQMANELSEIAIEDNFEPTIEKGEGLNSTGKAVNNAKNARTTAMYGFGYRCAVNLAEGPYEYNMYFYGSDGSVTVGHAIGSTGYTSGISYLPSTAIKFALMFHRKDLKNITDEDVSNIKSLLTIYTLRVATVNAVDGLSNRINILHNLVDYGYGYGDQTLPGYSGSNVIANKIDVKRRNMEVTLNLDEAIPNYALSVRVTSGLKVGVTTGDLRGWTDGITLINGHRYRASVVFISGTVEGTATPPVTISVLKVGTTSSVGTPDGTGVRDFVFDGDPINIAIYVNSGTTLADAKYQVILQDVTESVLRHNEKPTLSKTQKQNVLDLITSYMSHATDTKYDTSTTWNDYVSKSKAYDNNGKLFVCCSAFAQLIWAGISPNTFFSDPENYNADIIKAFDWGYNMPFLARRRAGRLAVRNGSTVESYYGFQQGSTDEESYSHTTYYAANSSLANSQKFRAFMYAADIAAELCMAGYEIPIGEADVGDLLFYRSTPYAIAPFSNTSFRQITHVAVVTGKTDGFYELAESSGLFDDRGIFRTSIYSEDDAITARAVGMIRNLVMAARHPAAYGVAGNVPNKFTTVPTRV